MFGGDISLFDSKTSRPRSFWFNICSGWNFLAFTICDLNHVLASSCSISSRFAWLSSMCLDFSQGRLAWRCMAVQIGIPTDSAGGASSTTVSI